jgi:hypothetical protein
VACFEVLVAGDACNEGEGVVVHQGRSIALVGVFLIGCAVLLLVVGCAGTRSADAPQDGQGNTEATKEQTRSPEATASEEEARCQGTRSFQKKLGGQVATNDLPDCPHGGLLLGTDKPDKLAGHDGDDEVRGLGGADELEGDQGNDILYGGDGNDTLEPPWTQQWGAGKGEDVFYGGDGSDLIDARGEGQPDKLYCGNGKDRYLADNNDYVASSCETRLPSGYGSAG